MFSWNKADLLSIDELFAASGTSSSRRNGALRMLYRGPRRTGFSGCQSFPVELVALAKTIDLFNGPYDGQIYLEGSITGVTMVTPFGPQDLELDGRTARTLSQLSAKGCRQIANPCKLAQVCPFVGI
jgi:hypothetical protein